MGLNPSLRLILVFIISLTAHFKEILGSENSDLFVPCKPDWYFYGEKCYKILGLYKPLTWWKSKGMCALEGGHLASIHSSEMQEFLITFLLLNAKSSVWIGLHQQLPESDFSWDDDSIYNFRDWVKNEPFGIFTHRDEYCVEMRYYRYNLRIGIWNDLPCFYERPFLCQINKNEAVNSPDPRFCSLEDGGGWKYLHSCYHIVQEPKSWEDAEKYCEENFNGYLVTILDRNSELFLNYVLGLSNLSKNLWIGINIRNSSMQKWTSGWIVNYKKLNQEWLNFGNDTCVLKSNQSSWAIASCFNKYPFICEKLKCNDPDLKGTQLDEWRCPNSSEKWLNLGRESCYYIESQKPLNWFKANDVCKKIGGSLASFHSEHETFVLRPLVSRIKGRLFIGLKRKNATEDVFEWADGSEVIYQNWNKGEPYDVNHECGELGTETMKWYRNSCYIAKGYICKSMKVLSKMKETPAPFSCKSTVSKDQTYSGGIPAGIVVGIVICTLLVVLLVVAIYHSRNFWKRYFVKTGNDDLTVTVPGSLGHGSEQVIWKSLR